MNQQYTVAHLDSEKLTEIQELEQKLRSASNENIVLIAYSESRIHEDSRQK